MKSIIQKTSDHYVPPLLDALDDWSILDSYYIPTRYPNGLPADIPARVYNCAAARSALALAEAVYARMDTWFTDTHASEQGDR
jgi:HEPN domain-containing protein